MNVLRIGLRLFFLPAGWIFKGQNMRVRFLCLSTVTVYCVLLFSYTVYFISYVTVWLPLLLFFKSMDGFCCKIYQVRSKFQSIIGVVPKCNQEIQDSQRTITPQLLKKLFIQHQRRNLGKYVNRIGKKLKVLNCYLFNEKKKNSGKTK